MRELPKIKFDLKKPESFGNLAEKIGPDERRLVATELNDLIDTDDGTMNDWAGEAQGFLDEMEHHGNPAPQNREQEGAGEDPPPSTEMTLTSCIQFSARATDALLGEPDLAQPSEDSDDGRALAEWVSSQLRTKDPNWTLDTDPLIVHMSVTGLGWRKRTFDEIDQIFHSYFIPSVGPHRVIINKNVRSPERAPRITEEFERYPYEIKRAIDRNKWVDYDPRFDDADPEAPKRFREVDLWLDLDDDGIDEPWTITISCDDMAEVVRIRPRWSKKTIVDNDDMLFFKPIRHFYPYRFLPDPKGGFLPMGFGKLLKRVQGSADKLLANIIDTAESEAANGGILGGSSTGLPNQVELKNNRVQTVPTDGRKLSDLFMPFPDKQVSPGSVQMLDKIMTLGDRLAGTLNLLENAPASMTATLAKGLIDTTSQIQSAVHRRMCSMLTQEMRMFVEMADAYDQLPDGVTAQDGGGVAITADPQLATEMHRAALGGLYMQMLEAGAKVPGSFNIQETAMRFCKTMRLAQPQKLMAPPPGPPQATPYEKIEGFVKLQKQKTEHMKATASVAMNLTQALLNMVEAAGGMQNNQAALLTMAQLEHTVSQLIQDADANTSQLDGMAQQPGNQETGSGAAQPQDSNPNAISGGGAGGPSGAGAGSGLS